MIFWDVWVWFLVGESSVLSFQIDVIVWEWGITLFTFMSTSVVFGVIWVFGEDWMFISANGGVSPGELRVCSGRVRVVLLAVWFPMWFISFAPVHSIYLITLLGEISLLIWDLWGWLWEIGVGYTVTLREHNAVLNCNHVVVGIVIGCLNTGYLLGDFRKWLEKFGYSSTE